MSHIGAGKFTVVLELGNDTMLTTEDVARALEAVAESVRRNAPMGADGMPVHDANGNCVGKWLFTEARDADAALVRGYDAGNYAGAYDDASGLDGAWAHALRDERYIEYRAGCPEEFEAAYVLGFFSSYEGHEVPPAHRAKYNAALAGFGERMRALGIAIEEDA